jgi:hypothetical protein
MNTQCNRGASVSVVPCFCSIDGEERLCEIGLPHTRETDERDEPNAFGISFRIENMRARNASLGWWSVFEEFALPGSKTQT